MMIVDNEPAEQSENEEIATKQFMEPCDLVGWSWQITLIGRVQDDDESKLSDPHHVVFISPTASGLDALEESKKKIAAIWLFAFNEDNSRDPYFFQIKDISTWTTRTPSGRHLSVLRTAAGSLICIQDDELFTLKATSTDWDGSGPYKRESVSVGANKCE